MTIKVISQNVMCWERKDNSYSKRRKMLKKVFHDHGDRDAGRCPDLLLSVLCFGNIFHHV